MLDLPATLAAIPDRELHALRVAIEGSPNIVPGLLAWRLFVEPTVNRIEIAGTVSPLDEVLHRSLVFKRWKE